MRIKKRTFQIFGIFLTFVFIWSFDTGMGVCQETGSVTTPGSIKIAGLQMNVTREIQKNKQTILSHIRLAAEDGARFLVTPEGSLSGYRADFDQEELSLALREVRTMARVHGIGLFLGTCFKEMVDNREITYNQIRVYAPDGSFLGAHSKILLCSPVTTPGTGEMHDYGQGYLKTIEWAGLRFGMLICNDLWATPGYTTLPNSYLPLQLKQMGADIIIHSINSGSDQRYRNFHESSVELWAYTLHLPIMEVNAAIATDPVNAQSGLINEQGERIVRIPEIGEHLFYCEIPGVTP
jgi:predicted amidohydrolase